MTAVWRAFRRWLREPRILWRAETTALDVTVEAQSAVPFAVFAAVFLWYVIAPSPVALMSAVALGGVLLASFLWARMMARGVRGERRLKFAAMQVGDALEEQISLRNATYIPVLWAEFFDRSNIPGYTVSSARAADPVSRVEWRAHTVCTRRGIFRLGPWELRIGEPFGLFLVRQVYRQEQELLVYPPLAALPQSLLPHHGSLGDHRPLNQPLRAETIVSSGVRSFTPGDPLRHLHWRTTARRGSPFVKLFAPEAASNVWLLPDFDVSVHSELPLDASAPPASGGSESAALLRSSLETMVTVTASLAAELLQQRLTVGMLASASDQVVVMPRQGQSHLWTILQALVPLEAVQGSSLENLLDRARSLIKANDLLIIVTPSTQPAWIAPLRRLAQRRGSSGRAEVILLDPASFGGTHQAQTMLTTLQSQGIAANLLRAEDVRPISGYYGEISRWEFKVVGHGKAVASKTPRLSALFAGMSPFDREER